MNNGTEVDIMNMAHQEGMVDRRRAGPYESHAGPDFVGRSNCSYQ